MCVLYSRYIFRLLYKLTDSELWYFFYCIYVCVYLFLYLNIDLRPYIASLWFNLSERCDHFTFHFYCNFFYTVNTKLGLRYSVIFVKNYCCRLNCTFHIYKKVTVFLNEKLCWQFVWTVKLTRKHLATSVFCSI